MSNKRLMIHFDTNMNLNSFKLSTDWRLSDRELNLLRTMEGVHCVYGDNYEYVITFGILFWRIQRNQGKLMNEDVQKMCEDCLINNPSSPSDNELVFWDLL